MTDDKFTKRRAMMRLCRGIFTSNLIGTDFDDVQVVPVTGQDFQQQHDGAGIRICFSVSWHAIGKIDQAAHDALDAFEPTGGWDCRR